MAYVIISDEATPLLYGGFTFKISEMLHISSTLYRRLEGTDLIEFSEITDVELDSVISVYKATHPNDGEVMVIGHRGWKGAAAPSALGLHEILGLIVRP